MAPTGTSVASGSGWTGGFLLSISIRPLKDAPSSTLIRAVVISPITSASFLISTRSRTLRSPVAVPYTITSRAVTWELNWAVRPIVTLWPGSEIGPSIFPSICRSSSPEISPLISNVDPKQDKSRAVGLLGRIEAVALSGAPGNLDSRDEAEPGCSVCGSLVHMVPPSSSLNGAFGGCTTSAQLTLGAQRKSRQSQRGIGLFKLELDHPDR